MGKKLYVGGLPYSTSEEALAAAFGQAGTVTSVAIIIDKMTNRSKGFGFVEMSTEEEAAAAIAMWDGKDFEGRNLKVNEARPMEKSGSYNRDDRGGSRGGSRGGDDRRRSW